MSTHTTESPVRNTQRTKPIRHIFCSICNGEGPGPAYIALCGTVAPSRGTRVFATPDHCIVCQDMYQTMLWSCGHGI